MNVRVRLTISRLTIGAPNHPADYRTNSRSGTIRLGSCRQQGPKAISKFLIAPRNRFLVHRVLVCFPSDERDGGRGDGVYALEQIDRQTDGTEKANRKLGLLPNNRGYVMKRKLLRGDLTAIGDVNKPRALLRFWLSLSLHISVFGVDLAGISPSCA